MLLEAASSCDSSPFARLQPPVLIISVAYWCTIQWPSSSPFPAGTTTRNTNNNSPRRRHTVALFLICIQDVHPEAAVPSASLLAANCLPVASAAHVRFVLPLATNHLANCSPKALEDGLCFNRDLRIQETSIITLCQTAQDSRTVGSV